MCYGDDGLLEIDDSAAERAVRVIALGRNNHLFVASNSSGQRAASLYSLIGCPNVNGLDPPLYLCIVLSQISTHAIN